MDTPLTVVARLIARPECADELLEALDHLIRETRQEPGCVHYDLYRNPDAPEVFVFHETWATRAHWEAHNAAPHLEAFAARAPDLLAGPAQVDPLYPVA